MSPANPVLYIAVVAAVTSVWVFGLGLLWERLRSQARRDRIVDVVVRRGSVELQMSASGDLREINKILEEVLSSIDDLGDTTTTVETRSKAESAFSVVRAFNQVERAAAEYVSSLGHPGLRLKRLSIFDMQRVIQQEGVWSDEDNRKFKRLVQLRNSIVHEDGNLNLIATDIQRVVDDANKLADMLRRRTKKPDLA